ncbi:MAG: hypothetical protein U5L02_01770 [Rheinheimera sp.]|nr:hypothetical protein [Rheinheimera sp.]
MYFLKILHLLNFILLIKKADEENIEIMTSLNKKIYTFNPINNTSKKLYNVENVSLCVGAQVIITYNVDKACDIINGKIAIIKDIDEFNKNIVLELYDRNNKPYEYILTYINKYNEMYDEKTETLKKEILYSYIPLKLGYCISVHKSQSLTIEYLEIDFSSGSFSSGHLYTALLGVLVLIQLKLKMYQKKIYM